MAVIDDLVAYYPLDETSGNAIDAHGANDLTDTNTVGAATGKVSGARDFEVSNAEYFTVADNADLSLGSDTPFTLAGWVQNEQDFQSGTVVLGKWSSGSLDDGAFCIYIKGANFRYTFVIANGTTSTEVSDTTVYPTPANTWAFLVAWHDPTADKIYIQVNNDATPDEAAWSGGTQNDTHPFRLGHDNGAHGSHWDGLLDEWGFWKRVLTSDERTWLYNAGSGRSYADIVAEGSAALDTFRPSGTLSAGTWVPLPSGTLHGVTSDEDDATYAESSTGSGSDTLDLSFPSMSTPAAGTVTFYIRHMAGDDLDDLDDITGSGDLVGPGGTGSGSGTVT